MQAEIDVGRIVAGKYELVRLVGKGAKNVGSPSFDLAIA